MADRVNGGEAPDPTNDTGPTNAETQNTDPSQRPAGSGAGASTDGGESGSAADPETGSGKAEVMEEVQRDASREREENRGYQ